MTGDWPRAYGPLELEAGWGLTLTVSPTAKANTRVGLALSGRRAPSFLQTGGPTAAWHALTQCLPSSPATPRHVCWVAPFGAQDTEPVSLAFLLGSSGTRVQ